jgi:hypothetical protein
LCWAWLGTHEGALGGWKQWKRKDLDTRGADISLHSHLSRGVAFLKENYDICQGLEDMFFWEGGWCLGMLYIL